VRLCARFKKLSGVDMIMKLICKESVSVQHYMRAHLVGGRQMAVEVTAHLYRPPPHWILSSALALPLLAQGLL